MFKKPTKMTDKEIWAWIMDNSYISKHKNRKHPTRKANYKDKIYADHIPSEDQIRAMMNKLASSEKQNKFLGSLGKALGTFVALCIFGGIIWLLTRGFISIKWFHCIQLSFLVYIMAKIAVIPIRKYFESTIEEM